MPKKEVNYDKDNKMVVSNQYIRAIHPVGMKLNDMKLFRLVITQCRMTDRQFYEYDFKVLDVAKAFQIGSENLYRSIQEMCKRMVQMVIGIEGDDPQKDGWDYRPIFKRCYCKPGSGIVTVQISEEVTDLFLELKKNFTQVPIGAILTMKSKYAIRVYELICEKLKGMLPYSNNAIEVQLSVDEIRNATGTNDKSGYDIMTNFKQRILDPSIKDIEENADWKIMCTDIKRGRKIVAFSLEIWDRNGYEVVQQCIREGKPLPQPKYKGTEWNVQGE